jgi:ubiquinone/menaquinone biosynthesis C-methylase UbiE
MNDEKMKLPQQMLPRGFAGRVTAWFMEKGHNSIYQNVANVLKLQPEDDVAEVACGSGYFLKKYTSHVRNVAGIDHSELMVQLAIKNNKERIGKGAAEFVHGEASKLPWEDGRFSVVTTMASFIGFSMPVESLKEMYRVLRPGGRVVISIEWHAEDGMDHKREVKQWGMGLYTEDQVRAMMKEAGFPEITIIYAKALGMPRIMILHAVKE